MIIIIMIIIIIIIIIIDKTTIKYNFMDKTS